MEKEKDIINEIVADEISAVSEDIEAVAGTVEETVAAAEEVIAEELVEEPVEAVEAVEEAVEDVTAEAAEAVETVTEEAAEETAEAAEAVEETVAVEFDEDEEFVPAITFADDYDDPVDDRDESYYESNAVRVRIHMQEQEAKAQPVAEVAKKRTLGSAIQNFFYHNKAACLIAAGVVLAVAGYVATRLFGW